MLTLLSMAHAWCLASRGLRFSELTGRMLRKGTMIQGSERGGKWRGGGGGGARGTGAVLRLSGFHSLGHVGLRV